MNIKYRCKNYSKKLKLCKRHYSTSICPAYVYDLQPVLLKTIYTCNEGIIEVDWITSITKQTILKECYNKL